MKEMGYGNTIAINKLLYSDNKQIKYTQSGNKTKYVIEPIENMNN
jgi:hypothetical protein